MRDHLTIAELNNYVDQALPPHELLALDAHLDVCAPCRQRLSRTDVVESAINEIVEDFHAVEASDADHLSSFQLVNYSRDELEPFTRKFALKHLERCQSCAEELQDLIVFKGEIEIQAPVARVFPRTTIFNKLSAPFMLLSLLLTARRSAATYILSLAGCGLLVFALAYFLRSNRHSEQVVIEPSIPTVPTVPAPSNLAPQSDTSAQGQNSKSNLMDPTLSASKVEGGSALEDVKSVANKRKISAGTIPVVLSLIDGGRHVTLDKKGRVKGLQTLSLKLGVEVQKALITQRLPTPPVVSELRGIPLRLLDGSSPQDTFDVVSPYGVVVLSDRPTLRWNELSGATGYMVDVVDSKLNTVASSEMLAVTQWTVTRPLPRGGVYRWQVTAIKDGKSVRAPKPPAPEAKFKVLESRKVLELNKLEVTASGSHLTLGVAYAREGLLEEAERELKSLVKDNPRSAVAKMLLNSLRAGEK